MENIDKERAVKVSLYGPHRDDYQIMVDDRSVMTFYSKGIRQVFSILIKLSQLTLLSDKYNGFPVLLLDDALSEIDNRLKSEIIEIIDNKTQLVYTSTHQHDRDIFRDVSVYVVSKGVLRHEEII